MSSRASTMLTLVVLTALTPLRKEPGGDAAPRRSMCRGPYPRGPTPPLLRQPTWTGTAQKTSWWGLASSAEPVGEWGLGWLAERMVQGRFERFVGSKAVGFSGSQSGLAGLRSNRNHDIMVHLKTTVDIPLPGTR